MDFAQELPGSITVGFDAMKTAQNLIDTILHEGLHEFCRCDEPTKGKIDKWIKDFGLKPRKLPNDNKLKKDDKYSDPEGDLHHLFIYPLVREITGKIFGEEIKPHDFETKQIPEIRGEIKGDTSEYKIDIGGVQVPVVPK